MLHPRRDVPSPKQIIEPPYQLYCFGPSSCSEDIEQIHQRLERFGILDFASVICQNALYELHDLPDCERIHVVIGTLTRACSARSHDYSATRVELHHLPSYDSETSRRVGLEFVCIFGQDAGPGRPWVPAYGLEKPSYESLVLSWALFS